MTNCDHKTKQNSSELITINHSCVKYKKKHLRTKDFFHEVEFEIPLQTMMIDSFDEFDNFGLKIL